MSETVTDNISDKGWSEEILPAGPETDQKFAISDQGDLLAEGEGEDFVEALKKANPTPEQNPTDKVSPAHTGTVDQDFFNKEEQWTATVIGELPTGETIQIKKKNDNAGAGFYVSYREGLKTVPKPYDGWYTSYDKAEQAARVFLNRSWDEAGATTASS